LSHCGHLNTKTQKHKHKTTYSHEHKENYLLAYQVSEESKHGNRYYYQNYSKITKTNTGKNNTLKN